MLEGKEGFQVPLVGDETRSRAKRNRSMTLRMENLSHFMDSPIQPAIDVIRMNAENLAEFRLSGFLGRPEKGFLTSL